MFSKNRVLTSGQSNQKKSAHKISLVLSRKYALIVLALLSVGCGTLAMADGVATSEKPPKAEKEYFNISDCENAFAKLQEASAQAVATDAAAVGGVELSDKKYQDFAKLHARQGIACTPWYVTMALGLQMLPDYAEDGTNGGLKDQRFFGKLNADAQWGVDGANRRWDHPKHLGVDLEFLGTAAIRDPKNKPGVLPTDFNDIASTLIASTYWTWQVWQWDGVASDAGAYGGTYDDSKPRCGVPGAATKTTDATTKKNVIVCMSSLSPILRAGAVSREKLTATEDSLIAFYSVGLQYRYDDYKRKGFRNGFPAGVVTAEYAYFEEYARRKNQNRLVVSAGMRIVRDMPVYFAYRGNYGPGPDEYTVGLVFVFGAEKLLSLF